MKKLLIILTCSFGLIFTFSGAAFGDLDDGLVAHYPFDGDANDASTFGNHGTEFGDLTYGEGKFGLALNMDGLNDYVKALSQDQINIENTLSVSAWVNIPLVEGGGALVCKGPSGANLTRNYYSAFRSIKANIQFCRDDQDHRLEAFNVNSDGWQHVVAILDTVAVNQHKTWNIYVDGKLRSRSYMGGSPSMPIMDGYDLMIGAVDANDPNTPRYFFNGMIDEVRIYNRVLTEEEILELYGNALSPWGPTSTLPLSPGGSKTKENSTIFNYLSLLLIPTGAVIFLRILGRKA